VVSAGSPLGADTFKVDQAHTFIFFQAKRAGFSYVVGRFNEFSGSATWDDNDPVARKIELTIQAGSVDTGNERREQHLKGPDFFNVKQFPVMTFESTEIIDTKVEGVEAAWKVTGDFSMHGVTKPVTFTLRQIGAGEDRRGNYNVGLEAEFVLKRSEFGMSNMLRMGGDDIRCTVEVLVQKQ
jgi:polyisoprenoid-binding protein YceI